MEASLSFLLPPFFLVPLATPTCQTHPTALSWTKGSVPAEAAHFIAEPLLCGHPYGVLGGPDTLTYVTRFHPQENLGKAGVGRLLLLL